MNKFIYTFIIILYIIILSITIADTKAVSVFMPPLFFMFEWQILTLALLCQKPEMREKSWPIMKKLSKFNALLLLFLWFWYMNKFFPDVNKTWFILIAYIIYLIHSLTLIFCKYGGIDQPRIKEEEKKRLQK